VAALLGRAARDHRGIRIVISDNVTFDREHHSADAIQRAAYRFSDRLSLDLVVEPTVFNCRLMILSDDEAVAALIVHDFRNEVLDQVLRERIRDETEGTRNVILSLAFSQTSLVDKG
jgi:His-Xaa-Ser system protein HxsD